MAVTVEAPRSEAFQLRTRVASRDAGAARGFQPHIARAELLSGVSGAVCGAGGASVCSRRLPKARRNAGGRRPAHLMSSRRKISWW